MNERGIRRDRAHARLNALRTQLQPHFLFSSLNAVAAQLRSNPAKAESTLMSLSELLRLALSQGERQEISLRDEMQFVQRYLDIQQTRFGDGLRAEYDVGAQALDCEVPTLLLQPLVENAIRHGIEPAENAGLVRVTARRKDASLVLTVEDDGKYQTNGVSESTDFSLAFPPATAPLLLDYEEFHPRSFPRTGKDVVFMDGHVAPLEMPPF